MSLPVCVDERHHHFALRSSSAWAKKADALRRISLARFSSRFSRSNALSRSRSDVVRWYTNGGRSQRNPGAANGSGAVDVSDAITTLAYLFSHGTDGDCGDRFDTNDTGSLDLADAIYTLTYLFAEGPAPPAPFPEPGVDPTDDGLDCR